MSYSARVSPSAPASHLTVARHPSPPATRDMTSAASISPVR